MRDWLVLARAVHFGACLLFFGCFAFDQLVASALSPVRGMEAAGYWQSRLKMFGAILPPVILLSGIAWFALVAAMMSGLPFHQALRPEILGTVWNQTQFGTLWKWRSIFWLASLAGAVLFLFKTPPRFAKALSWIQWGWGALLLGSLAWTGHGREGSLWHLLADVFHLLLAGLWPAGLLPFALLLRRLRQETAPSRWHSMAVLVRRFSALSLTTAALLAVSGLVNSWFLVGSMHNLFATTYGRWLLAKIIFFCAAVTIGAVNLLRLKPRLLAGDASSRRPETTAAQLQSNVQIEFWLGALIVVIVAVLGILPPASR